MEPPGKYHPRRVERDMPEKADQLAVVKSQKFMFLALSDGKQPYGLPLNYGFSESENAFYVHCALEGRKLDILRANPAVWGVIVEDNGYIPVRCSHAFRTVMFSAQAEFVESPSEKRHGLEVLIDQLEPDPAPRKARLSDAALLKTTILRLRVSAFSGKQNKKPS
jgi:nitroimidazol reductase NimA-like FMN-containing flavoprotein (pyridoxamine 5'-phosphate oxidase superfamily)